MPRISLVVCVYQERDLLVRLLGAVAGGCDEVVVIHDGPDTHDVRSLVEAAGGRFIAAGRRGSLEGQSPFAWAQARYDWILRLDADEIPSEEMNVWLAQFRQAPEPPGNVSGYTCTWPMWNGRQAVSKKIFSGRIFLFHKNRVRFFGLVEQVPLAEGSYESLPLTLHHQPRRKSYGLKNVLLRKQAWRWREIIARSLLGKPTDLPCWRWSQETWPAEWEPIRQRPLRTAFSRLVLGTVRTLRYQWREEGRIFPLAALANPVHHALICLKYWQLRRQNNRR